MKKLTALLLILILTALCAPALAANTDGLGDTVTRSAELAAFLDGNGNIYVSGLEKPVNATKAASLVSIDPYRILFFAQADALAGVPEGRLIALTLDGFKESTVSDDAYAACLDADSVYFISRANRTRLVECDLNTGTSVVVFSAAEALDRIYDSSIGIVATLVDGAGAYISDSVSGQFIPYVGDAAKEIAQGDGYEVYLTDSNNLYARMDGDLMPVQIDSNVRAWAVLGRSVYYLSGSDAELALRQYNVDANLWTFLLTPPANMEMQLTASENALFMLSSDHVIYSVDVPGRRLQVYTTLPSPQSYALNRPISGYRIEAVSGQLNVYGVVDNTNLQPTFTFVDFSAAPASDESDILLLSAYPIEAESTVWDLLQPAAQYSTLRRGSRGSAVSAIQQPLNEAGYYDYYIDGIFGWRTERAVELLQDALELPVNGVADADLQRRILSGNFPDYDPYRRLKFGARGLRVKEMQQRLRDLGYLADDADRIFGERTLAAVELFQRENGLSVDGIAGPETLRRLFSPSARTCSSYIELRRGDTGYRVRELNRRLQELYYLEGSAGSTFTYDTLAALKLFQAEVGLRQTGIATEAVQQRLFSTSAPEYSGYITLRRGDDNDRVAAMQRRLRDLGYYDGAIDGYFGKGTYQAVRAFQRQAGLRVTGVADPNTLKRLFANDAPEYQPPIDLTTPVIDFYGDSFEMDAGGVYLVPADRESLTFFWSAEGVASYDISLSSENEIITSMRGTTDEMAGVSTARLLPDVVYEFKVVAHPEDAVNNKDTNATLRFRIVSEPPVVERLIIQPTSDTLGQQDGVYQFLAEDVGFSWTAYGAVEYYGYTVAENGQEGDVIAFNNNTSDTQWRKTDLTPDPERTYTLTVTAYPPQNGEPLSESVEFCVVSALPGPSEEEPDAPTGGDETNPPAQSLSILPDGEVLSLEDDGTYQLLPENVRFSWTADGAVDRYSFTVSENGQGGGVIAFGENTQDTSWSASEIQPDAGKSYTLSVTAFLPGDSGSLNASVAFRVVGATPTEASPEEDAGEDEAAGSEPAETTGTESLPAPFLQANPAEGEVAMEVTQPDGSVATESVVSLGEGTVELSWATAGSVAGYQVTITDSQGNVMADNRLTNPSARLNAENLVPGEVYTLTATAFFNGGETTSSTLHFMKPGAEEPAVEPETEEPAVEEPTVEEPEYEEPEYEEPTVEEPETEKPAVEEPSVEESPVEQPVPLGSPALQVNPNNGAVETEVVHPDGDVTREYVVTVGAGGVELSWPAEGDVAEYQVTIADSRGNVVADNRMAGTSVTIDAGRMTPGEVYTLTAFAYSTDGQESAASLYFMRPVPEPEEEPEYEEPAYEEPAYEEPEYEEPEYEEPTYEEPEYEEPSYEEPEYEEPAYEEPEYEEPEYEEPAYEEPTYEEPAYEEPAYEEPAYEEPAYEEPVEEEPEDAGSGAGSDSNVAAAQQQLSAWGWLASGSYTPGVLDSATVQALSDFQSYCNENGMGLTPIDPSNPSIGSDTLSLLFGSDAIPKP